MRYAARYDIGGSLGGACAATALICFYAPFMRLPPLLAIVGTGPYLGLVLYLAVHDAISGRLTDIETLGYTATPLMSVFTVLMVCGVLECLLGRSYTREQLILEQQRGLEESRRMIRRYIPPAVAEQIIAGHADTIDSP